MKTKTITRMTCAAMLLLISAPCLVAQGTSSQLNGIVRDTSGAVVPDAQVTVTNVDTKTQRKTTSNGEGAYVVPLLPPGNYIIGVEKAGFEPVRRSGIALEVDQVATIDLALRIGNVTQAVEVVAAGPLLAVANSTLGEVVNNTEIQNLPMNGRQPFRLLELTPGIFKAPSSNGQYQDLPVNQGNESIFSISGGRAESNEVMIDGVPTTVGAGNTLTIIPPVEATGEFDVMSGPLKAEWGRTGGGVMNVYTKPGTNQIHGALFEFLRNDALDANDFFANLSGQAKGEFRMNQFGFTVGGPVYIPKIYKGTDKTFFFVDYQGARWRQGAPFLTTVPTAAQRQGDFTKTLTATGGLVTIYNPYTTTPSPASPGTYLRTPFAGNLIPASMLNPVAQKALSYVPMPDIAGNQFTNLNNYFSAAVRSINETDVGMRGDHSFNDKEKIFARYAYNFNDLIQPNYFGTVATPSDGALGDVVLHTYGAALHSVTTISPTTLLDVSAGYARWIWNRNQLSFGFDQKTLGLPASYVNQLQYPLFPAFTVANSGNIGGGNGLTLMSQDTTSLLSSLTKIHGRHTIKAGIDVRRLRNFLTTGDPAGTYNFVQAMTAGPNPNVFSAAAGSGIASFVLGTFSSGSVNILAGASQQAIYYAGFVQDDFRINSKLTLNYGLRWETTSPFTERHNELNRFDPTVASPVRNSQFPNLLGALQFASSANRTVYPWNLANWQPRLGFAYNPLLHTVIRGGAGLVYAFFPTANAQTGFSPNQGFSATTTFLGTLDGVTPNNTLSNPAPQGLVQPTPASQLGASTYLGQSLTIWDNTPKTPRVWQWNFDIQQEYAGFLFDLAYVGSRGQYLNQPLPIDAPNPSYLSLGSALQQLVPNPFYGSISTGALANPTVQRNQLLLPYPQYTGIAAQNETFGDSIYHAMELKLKKRMPHGLTLLLGYTFSKLFANVSNTVVNNGNDLDRGLNSTVQNPYNLRAERSVSEMDAPTYLSINAVTELPLGQGQKFFSGAYGVVRKAISGWELSTVFLARAGVPLVFSAPGVVVGNRPNRSCSGAFTTSRTKAQEVQQWFNTSCFSVPAAFTFGTDSRTNPDIRGPSFTQLDLSLTKHNKMFHEHADLMFRIEAFNSLNVAHFALPQLSASASNFGQIYESTSTPRVYQVALKLTF